MKGFWAAVRNLWDPNFQDKEESHRPGLLKRTGSWLGTAKGEKDEGSTHSGGSYASTTLGSVHGAHLARSMSIVRLPSGGGTGEQQTDTGRKKWIIYPDNLWYHRWRSFHILLAAYSGFYSPFDFGFVGNKPDALRGWNLFVASLFIVDMVGHFFVAYIDRKRYVVVDDSDKIAMRYLKSWFLVDLMAAIPFDSFQRRSNAVLRWLDLMQLGRLRHFDEFFSELERDIRFSYFGVRIVRLLVVVVFSSHLSACIFYYLALTLPTAEQDNTWIGAIYNSPPGFRAKSIHDKYIISLYWSVVTMATVGYGDFHAVSIREMIWSIIFMVFNLVLMTYVLGSMTALIVRGSAHTQDFRDRIRELTIFITRHSHHLPRSLRRQMKMHTQLKYETAHLRQDVIDQYPKSIRAKITRHLYLDLIDSVYLFEGCSADFIGQIANEVVVEWYMPSEEIIHQMDGPTNFFIVADGRLDIVETGHEGIEENLETIEVGSMFGEIGVLCNVPQPYTVRSIELVRVLRMERIMFNNIVHSYTEDGRRIVQNLLKRARNENDVMAQRLSQDIESLIAQQEVELTMSLCYVASRGDLAYMQRLLKGGISANRADYDGRTPMHLCANKGFDDCIKFLLQSGADINCKDNFGYTPLMEAIKNGKVDTAKVIFNLGGRVNLAEAGSEMCNAAIHGNISLLELYISFGVDPDAYDYDNRTALHIGSAEGFMLVVKLLLKHGADPLFEDRWGHTAISEAQRWNHPIILAELNKAVIGRSHPHLVQEPITPPVDAPPTEIPSPELVSNQPPEGETQQEETRILNDNSILARMASGSRLPSEMPIHLLGTTSAVASIPKRKRVTINRHHPRSPEAVTQPGRAIVLPATMKALLVKAGDEFDYIPTKVLNARGAIISDITLIEDGDILYIVDNKEAKAPPPTSAKTEKEVEIKELLNKLQILLAQQ